MYIDNAGNGGGANSGDSLRGPRNTTLADGSSVATNGFASEVGNTYSGKGGSSTGGKTSDDGAMIKLLASESLCISSICNCG